MLRPPHCYFFSLDFHVFASFLPFANALAPTLSLHNVFAPPLPNYLIHIWPLAKFVVLASWTCFKLHLTYDLLSNSFYNLNSSRPLMWQLSTRPLMSSFYCPSPLNGAVKSMFFVINWTARPSAVGFPVYYFWAFLITEFRRLIESKFVLAFLF